MAIPDIGKCVVTERTSDLYNRHIGDLAAVEVTLRCDGSKRYAGGVGWEGATADIAHCGSPISRRDLSDWREIPFASLEPLFPTTFAKAVEVLTDETRKVETFYFGKPEAQR